MRVVAQGLAVVFALVWSSGPASADTSSPTAGPAWFFDGGAVPLFWIPVTVELSLELWVKPRSTPLFSWAEGGATVASWEIPDWTLYIAGAGVGTAFAVGNDPSRWYHVKGLTESVATAGLVMTVTKEVFGRHRPDWTPTTSDPIERESFPSGHATEAFAIATYAALYLHGHVFRSGLTVGRGFAYGGIFAAAGLVDAERVYHHRHFVSDVVVGSIVGAVTSILVYRYQDGLAPTDGTTDSSRVFTSGRNANVLSWGGSF